MFLFHGFRLAQIVGGTESRPNSIPFIISLQSSGRHFCAGSLIVSNLIMCQQRKPHYILLFQMSTSCWIQTNKLKAIALLSM